jgi:hypothetical protein
VTLNENSGGTEFGGISPLIPHVRVRETMLKTHKFQIGQVVCFTSRPVGHMTADDAYCIVKLLPSDGDDYQYRIKSAKEAFERVARESQLDRVR